MNMQRLENFLDEEGILFLSYVGTLSQELLSNMTEALEKEVKKNKLPLSISTDIFVIFIELSQNIIKYSKEHSIDVDGIDPKGVVLVGYNNVSNNYYVLSRNIVSEKDKTKIENKLKEIDQMTEKEVRLEYRNLRKSGLSQHDKGAGIGMLEIAKRCDKIEFKFDKINEKQYQYVFQANIDNKTKEVS